MSSQGNEFAEEALFGEIAVTRCFITPDQADAAKKKQKLLLAHGIEKRLGAILVEDRLLTHEQVREILTLQKKAVLKCPGCGGMFNIEGFQPGKRFICSKCGTLLEVPSPEDNVDVVEVIPEPRAIHQEVLPNPQLVGREIGGCKVERALGQGAMGAVYLAHQVSLDRPVALKVLRPNALASEECVVRFEREARSVARLIHPNIVQVYDMGRTADGHYFIVMEYVDGQTLGQRVKGGGSLGEKEALQLIAGAADGLAEAHRAGVIHRDIKPDNLMVDRKGRVKVADFGLVRATESSVGLTRAGATLGTPAYMAPEQGMGSKVDHRADLYALGATLYRLIAGNYPYQGDSPMAIMMKHVKEPVPRIRRKLPYISPATEALIVKAMAKDPDDRFEDAPALASAARAIARGEDSGLLTPPPRAAKTAEAPQKERFSGPRSPDGKKEKPHRSKPGGGERSKTPSGRRQGVRKTGGPVPVHILGAGAGVLILLVVLIVVLVSGKDGGEPEEPGKSKKPGPESVNSDSGDENGQRPVEAPPEEPDEEPAPPSPNDKVRLLVEETERVAKGLVREKKYPEAIAAWSDLLDRAREQKLSLNEDTVFERISAVKRDWGKEASSLIRRILSEVEKLLTRKGYAEALERIDSFPNAWRVVPGIDDGLSRLAYQRRRAEYLLSKTRPGSGAGSSSSRNARRRKLEVGKEEKGFLSPEMIRKEWVQKGDVTVDEKENIVRLKAAQGANRATLYTNFPSQDRWLDYEVSFSYKSDSDLFLVFRIRRRGRKYYEFALPKAREWTSVRLVVSGVNGRLERKDKEARELLIDPDPGHFGFVYDRSGAAALKDLRIKITRLD